MDYLNGFHKSIKFTFEMEYEKRTTHWLDCQITMENGTITTDLYRKPESSVQYLLPSSCHSTHCWKNIPYSLAFRLRRICSEEATFHKRLEELQTMLTEREYPKKVIDAAFDRVKKLSREQTLQKVEGTSKEKTTFVITYDPRLPNAGKVLQKQFKTMTLDPVMKEAFPEGVQVGFKRYRNLKETLCRARLYDIIDRPIRETTLGWKKCTKCGTCQRSENRHQFRCSATGEVFQIEVMITCKDVNVIYIIECQRCAHKPQYAGKTKGCLMVKGGQRTGEQCRMSQWKRRTNCTLTSHLGDTV